MKTIRFIGDVHGKYGPYKRLIAEVPRSIQVGDMGVGFRRYGGPRDGEIYGNPPHYAMVAGDHRFIRGNHDNPAECEKHSQWIPDGNIEEGMMFIGGATSIDKESRREDYSWWPDEELSYETLRHLIDVYAEAKPRIMVTHDCPQSIADLILGQHYKSALEPKGTRTRQAFEQMLAIHNPEIWIFGHWHMTLDYIHEGTRFICLAELEHRDIEI